MAFSDRIQPFLDVLEQNPFPARPDPSLPPGQRQDRRLERLLVRRTRRMAFHQLSVEDRRKLSALARAGRGEAPIETLLERVRAEDASALHCSLSNLHAGLALAEIAQADLEAEGEHCKPRAPHCGQVEARFRTTPLEPRRFSERQSKRPNTPP